MHLTIRSRHVELSSALREHSTKRLERALEPFLLHVASAELVFSDLNGPRGGPAQSCRVSVGLNDGTMLMVQNLDSDFYVASGLAAGRVGYLVGRELERTRKRARRAPTSLLHRRASPNKLREQLGARGLSDGAHRGVADLTVHGDRVEPFAHTL